MTGPVVITGAGSGIGRALALVYAEPGRPILLLGRRQKPLDVTAEQARSRGAVVSAISVDVCNAQALDGIARDFSATFGNISIVIANAGISHGTLALERADRPVFAEIITTNLLGMDNTCTAFLPYLTLDSRIAGIASVAGFRGLPGAAAYSASKAGVIAYLESLRLELKNRGTKVSCISPGYIATPMTAENHYPMPWLMDPDKAAQKIRRAIDRGQAWLVVPWQMALVGMILRHLPDFIYDRIFTGVAGKARKVK
ncbi:short-chain dehydrogenase [Acidithiobacillus marinus]|uniref:Short-chain dehydrogenase n=1 Tax=Acidithiobacillus marinus TaxID=187490 RepID=A0A2I1DI88_9PROT|nr:short-chain dehydrogenase [Acidithiobacillus marinus]